MFLIMDCIDYCESVNREPLAFVEDWKVYYESHKDDLNLFEVYEWDGENFTLVKEYEIPMEYGMAFFYVPYDEEGDEEEKPQHIIKQWENATRNDLVPYEVLKAMYDKETYDYKGNRCEPENELSSCGCITWYDEEGNYYVYSEYHDNDYNWGC